MKDIKLELEKKIDKKQATVGIIGLGYAGLPIALRFADEGYKVIGIDKDKTKVKKLNNKKNPFVHMDSEHVERILSKDFFSTSEPKYAEICDVIILCLPTPIDSQNRPDLSFIINTMNSISSYLREGQLLILESTTYPGTTEEVLLPYVSEAGFIIGNNFFLGYSPEREDPGNEEYSTKSIPKLCAGITRNCTDLIEKFYLNAVDEVIKVSSPAAAEMSKLLENIYRAVNIGLVNEMKIIADAMQIDIHEVINAAATKPFGFKAFYPGPGLGGHCIPVDPFYLSWKAQKLGLRADFIELSGEVNKKMPSWVLNKTNLAMKERNLELKDSNILILGLSYKRNIDDLRESPSIELMEILTKEGVNISYSDPYVPSFPRMRQHAFDLKSVEILPEQLKKYDAVILATDHDDFDYDLIQKNSSLIIDTRGRYKGEYENIIKA